MAKELKQMLNKVTVQGTLMDSSIEIKVDKNGRRYLSGEVEIKTDEDYIIPISVFTYELKNSGEKSAIYDRLVKFIDYPSARTVGIAAAPKLAVSSARLEDNSFYSERDSKIISNWRIGGSFINAAANDAIGQNGFEVQGVIASIKEVITRDGESTDTYDLRLLNVSYGNRINELTFRFDDPKAVKYINGNYNPGDLVTICGKVVYEQQERVVEKELGFGAPVKQTYTNTYRLLRITAGTPAEDGAESGYALKDLQDLLAVQNATIIEKYNARAKMNASSTKSSTSALLF